VSQSTASVERRGRFPSLGASSFFSETDKLSYFEGSATPFLLRNSSQPRLLPKLCQFISSPLPSSKSTFALAPTASKDLEDHGEDFLASFLSLSKRFPLFFSYWEYRLRPLFIPMNTLLSFLHQLATGFIPLCGYFFYPQIAFFFL